MPEIIPLMEWIERNLHRKITLPEMTRKSGYTSRHLYNLFMAGPGVSPSAYIRQRKLSLASIMLRDTRRPVTEIALMYGFEHSQSFTRADPPLSAVLCMDSLPAVQRQPGGCDVFPYETA
ncbi:helix-turn-helix transcriptional regulator [Salmonella enterica subsp. enterica serovar Kottbus]|nr:helix-turn-helix transcriptional regulator [Salmonella enterica subsp. enterica]EII1445202.1 helix-turn-helix transcriptional regulator [Salmonella enterica subsp. enterica serovar Kottbus]